MAKVVKITTDNELGKDFFIDNIGVVLEEEPEWYLVLGVTRLTKNLAPFYYKKSECEVMQDGSYSIYVELAL